MSFSNPIVIYHGGGCPDGFAAAWAIWKKYPGATFIPANYSDAPPEGIENKDVIIVDFSFKAKQMLDIVSRAKSLILLDHHKTAIEDLEELNFQGILDSSRSGAGLTWDYFHAGEERPWLIDYIEYRDLGHLFNNEFHPFDNVEEILLAISSYPQTFEDWDRLLSQDFNQLLQEGVAIKRYRERLIEQVMRSSYEIDFNGEKVKCVNTPLFQSEIGNRLVGDYPFSVTWFQLPGKTKFSLRSKPGKADVSERAKNIGGGGHENASAFEGQSVHIQDIIKNLHGGKSEGRKEYFQMQSWISSIRNQFSKLGRRFRRS